MKVLLGRIILCSGQLACVLSPAAASAGPVFKCVDARGVASYQQTPCPASVAQAGRGFVPIVARAPALGWTSQPAALAARQVASQGTVNADAKRQIETELRRMQSQATTGSPVIATQLRATSASSPGVAPRKPSVESRDTQPPAPGFVQANKTN